MGKSVVNETRPVSRGGRSKASRRGRGSSRQEDRARGETGVKGSKPPELEACLEGLVQPGLIFVPIRHHSPVCARLTRHVICQARPRAVLVEGPAAFTSLIPWLLHPQSQPPFAVYVSCVAQDARASDASDPDPPGGCGAFGPARRAAYYPFCRYSPELVALRAGADVGAALRFIDLDFAEQVQPQLDQPADAAAPRAGSLLSERHLARSRFLQALARRAGCRDHNDLWDHCFETRLGEPWESDLGTLNPEAAGGASSGRSTSAADQHEVSALAPGARTILRDIAAWCFFARVDAAELDLVRDGTIAREAAMTAAIRAELAAPTGDRSRPVVVVTGGFHTVALAGVSWADRARVSRSPETGGRRRDALARSALASSSAAVEARMVLVRYGFEQLDALNGYASGMPSPFYYEQLWQAAEAVSGPPEGAVTAGIGPGAHDPFTPVCARVLVDLARLTRRRKLAVALSPADEIAALAQARQLARLRGHPGPTREDLLDGIRSCFAKGALDAEGKLVLDLARHVMAGTAIGAIPEEAGLAPLVQDFQILAATLRLKIDQSARRRLSLDLYRRGAHRRTSRLFHQLGFLDVPFARLDAGPDFVRGRALERLHEHWDYQWTPETESGLIEAGVYGATLEEAAANRLAETVTRLGERGESRSADAAVRLVVAACRMGLHRQAGPLLDQVGVQIGADPSLISLATGLRQLTLLWESREPLEAHGLSQIPRLIQQGYERFCFLLHGLGTVPADAAGDTLESLLIVHEIVRMQPPAGPEGGTKEAFLADADLFLDPLAALLNGVRPPPLLAGAAAGLLHAAGRLDRTSLVRQVTGFLSGFVGGPGESIAFLTGLLRAARELAWQEPALVETVHRLLTGWSQEEFIARLPALRLAFADLTPRETDRLAEAVSQHLKLPGPLISPAPSLTESEAIAALRLTETVRTTLQEDGLCGWLSQDRAAAHLEDHRV